MYREITRRPLAQDIGIAEAVLFSPYFFQYLEMISSRNGKNRTR